MIDPISGSAAVTGILTLVGTLAGSVVQMKISQSTQRSQREIEARKHEADERSARRAEVLEQMARAHQLLSGLQREFSRTTLDIIWRSKMSDTEYDQRYEDVRVSIDELRLVAELRLPTIAGDAERLSAESSNFWFHFKNVLSLTQQGADYTAKVQSLSEAHKAADEIWRHASRAKDHLAKLAARQNLQIA